MKNLNEFNGLKVGDRVAEADVAGVVTSEVIGKVYEIAVDLDMVWVKVQGIEFPEVTSEYAFWLEDGEPVPMDPSDTIGDLLYLLVV